MKKRVVITGGGAISALGSDWDTISHSLKAQKNCVRYMSEWDQYPDLHTRLAAPIDNFSLPKHFTLKRKRSMGRVAMQAVLATEYALTQAGLLNDPLLASGEVGIAYGSATGSSDAALEFFSLLENHSMQRINGTTYLRMMSHTAAVNISVYFGTAGRMYTTSSACTAGSQAIGFAFEAIRNGQQLVMIAGGGEELCPTQAAVFDTVYATSTRNDKPQSSPRPFDRDRDGLVIGEGACTLILESFDHALQRGAKIYGEVVGFATNTDGAHLVRQQPAKMETVMRMALADAQLSPDKIGYISAHGTATELGDIAETTATETVMGSNVPFSSLKSYVGHGLGVCGALEAWTGINMMNEGWFAPTLNLDQVDSRCGKLDYIRGEIREIDTNYFMSNNFAFGGINTSLIFKSYLQS